MSICPKLLAIDPSLTQTGWALFELGKKEVLEWGVIGGGSSRISLEIRLVNIQTQVRNLLEQFGLTNCDYLICEGPAPITLNPSSSIKVEQVRGIFETLARDMGISVLGRVNPKTVQAELLGIRGKQLPRKEVKDLARLVIKRIYPKIYQSTHLEQDIIDAMLIGILAETRISNAIKAGQDPLRVFEIVGKSSYSSKRSGGRGLNWGNHMIGRRSA